MHRLNNYKTYYEMYDDEELKNKVLKICGMEMVYRHERKWPLINYNYDSPYYNHIYLKQEKTCDYLNKKYHVINPKDFINRNFPHLETILKKYKGKLIACGGAVTEALNNRFGFLSVSNQDVDLFFYNCTENEATEILKDCVAILASEKTILENYYSRRCETDEWKPSENLIITNIVVSRSMKYTNVGFDYIWDTEEHPISSHSIYQFIHRIYPTMDSIIGGFDIPLCMSAYDGDNFFVTPYYSFCVKEGIIIADLSRRSPSFEYRLSKYSNRYNAPVYFPGLDWNSLSKSETKDNLDYEMLSSIRNVMEDYGYNIKFKQPLTQLSSALTQIIDFENIEYGKKWKLGKISFSLNLKIHVRQIDNKNLSIDETQRYSDYSHSNVFPIYYNKVNSSALMTGNIDSIKIYKNYRQKYSNEVYSRKEVLEDFNKICDEPKIDHLSRKELEDRYNKVFEKFERKTSMINNYCWDPYYWPTKSWFVKILGMTPFSEEEIPGFPDILKIHNDSLKKANIELKGIKWITKNPGKQWTSSNTPMPTTGEFYNEFYNGATVGINKDKHKMLSIIFLVRMKLPKDMFNMIMKWICVADNQYSLLSTNKLQQDENTEIPRPLFTLKYIQSKSNSSTI